MTDCIQLVTWYTPALSGATAKKQLEFEAYEQTMRQALDGWD
jgi:hypothetical protein